MRVSFLLAAGTVVLSTQAAAQMPPGMAELRASEKSVSKPIKIESYGSDPLQKGELRLPAGKGPFPVAVVIHGGCWTRSFEGMSGTAPLADMLTKRGIATWNIEYRAVGDKGGGWPGTFSDVAAGVDHLKSLARRYPLDMKRAALVGHSAGAHLALWSASRPKLPAPWNKPAWTPAAVAAIDGPPTLAPYVGLDQEICGMPVLVPLMGGTPAQKPTEYKLASPMDHLPLGPRTLLVKASLGFALNPYQAAATAKGDDVRAIETDKNNHFDMITPGTANGEKTADWLAANLFAKTGAKPKK